MKIAVRIAGAIVALLLVLAAALAAYLYASAISPSRRLGFQQFNVADPGHGSIPVTVWYPSTAKPAFVLLGSRGMRVAVDGPVDGKGLPLIVMSHGTGGYAFSNADTAIALAEQGFVVAAPTHPGDNVQDDTDVGRPDWLVNRSRHLTRTIDAIIGTWKDRSHVDAGRIGAFGMSAGATTVLVSIGGKPNLRLIAAHCAQQPEFACKIMSPEAYRNLPPVAWTVDPRIKAAVVVAPGLGFTFDPDGLSSVRAPVQLWAGQADQTVPWASNAGIIERLLPVRPEVHVVPGAAHFSFLAPCGLIGPPQFCRDQKGFDRSSFHKAFNAEIARFFQKQL